ncbi:MAG: hypothetical protein WBP85_02850 [Terracidiphilus sp.]
MKARWIIGCFFLSSSFLVARAQTLQLTNDVHWCATIPSFRVLEEAKFSAVYLFDVDTLGKPVNIRRVNVPFISKRDKPLIDCVASWHLVGSERKSAATFRFEYGWIDVSDTSGGFKISVPAEVSGQNSR